MELQRGDIILYRGTGKVFRILSFALGLFDKNWRKLQWKPWHMAFVADEVANMYTIGESVSKGVTEAWLNPDADFRVYRWFNEEPVYLEVKMFLLDRAYCRYDLTIYLHTLVFYIIRHFFNRPIPKLLDNRYSCWELVGEFCNEMQEPIASKYDTFFITDILREIAPYQLT